MNNLELIDQYIDDQLSQPQAQQLEAMLQDDTDLQNLLESVIIARKSIRLSAITRKVKAIHEQYKEETTAASDQSNVFVMPVRRSYSWVVRIAASILLALVGYGAYQYTTLEPAYVYNDKFIPYQLPTVRSSAEPLSELNYQYAQGNYAAVIRSFSTSPAKAPSDYFLAGVSCLQQKDYQRAISLFTTLRQYNNQQNGVYFGQETDYYMALAYLGANRVEDAYQLFKTIHDTPRHLFSQSVTTLDLVKLNLLRLK